MARRSRPWRGTRRPRSPRIARPVRARWTSCRWLFRRCSRTRTSHGDALHAQCRLADANRHALAVLAAGADAGVERKVVADHADAVEVRRAVADQHRTLQRRADLAV